MIDDVLRPAGRREVGAPCARLWRTIGLLAAAIALVACAAEAPEPPTANPAPMVDRSRKADS